MTKNIFRSILIVLLVAIVFLCVKRWNAWFGNPVEPKFTPSGQIEQILLTLGNEGEMSRNVSWLCDTILTNGSLELTRENSNDTISIVAESKLFITAGGKSARYWAALGKLQEKSVYFYRLKNENHSISRWYRFETQDINDNHFSFLVFGDVQDQVAGAGKTMFENASENFPQADFYVSVGDFIERPMYQRWAELFETLDTLAQTKIFLAAAGNHEYHKGLERKLEERFIYTFSYFAENQNDKYATFGFDYGNASFAFLDSNRDFWNLPAQARWLDEFFKNAQQHWKIIVLHHPIFSIKGKLNNWFVKHYFKPIIEKYSIDLILQGHEHGYARMIAENAVYIVNNSSAKDYVLNFNKKYDRYGNCNRFYLNVAVENDTMFVKTFTENGDLYDCLRIVKNGETQIIDLATEIPQMIGIQADYKCRHPKQAAKYEKKINNWLNRIKTKE